MKKNFRLTSLISAIILTLLLVLPVTAQEKATKEECVEKVNAAVKLIQSEGLETSLKKIMDKDGPYVWKDSYVFCIGDEVGKTLAHPMPRIIGFPMSRYRDAKGDQPFLEVIEVANKAGQGWKSYYFQGRDGQEDRLKNAYFVKVPGANVIVSAGYYE